MRHGSLRQAAKQAPPRLRIIQTSEHRTQTVHFVKISCSRAALNPIMPVGMAPPEDPQKTTDEAQGMPAGRRNCAPASDPMICDRCGKAEMYRMHAVWRCPECGFKTDCCGW